MWCSVAIETDALHAEELSDALLEQGAFSVSVEDAAENTERETPQFGEPGCSSIPLWDRSRVVALFDPVDYLANRVSAVIAHIGLEDAVVELSEVAEQDWVRLTQSQFEPICINDRLWIVPSWHEAPDPAAINLALDPGLAFGTGSHPTTHLCLDWLCRYVGEEHIPHPPPNHPREGGGAGRIGCLSPLEGGGVGRIGCLPPLEGGGVGRIGCLPPLQGEGWGGDGVKHVARTFATINNLLDYGCGSGILGIAAAKLGAVAVTGVDIDERALEAAADNAARNQVTLRLLHSSARLTESFDIVIANILTNPLCVLAPLLATRVAPGGFLVLAGVLESQSQQVIEAYQSQQINLKVGAEKEGWVRLEGARSWK
ncbi:MAG: 50S ribosomal protein L11 methyltransferase [Rhodocyclaceae bacterium]|nr:50S ribosomal protein L11 methyltransferase [Rhodocyclaceae bacterium]